MKKYALINTYYGISEKCGSIKELVKKDKEFRDSLRWDAMVRYRGIDFGLPFERITKNSESVDKRIINFIKASCRNIDRYEKRK